MSVTGVTGTMRTMDPRPAVFPAHLRAIGTADAPFEPVANVTELPPGTLRRVSRGELDGCVVACPLHEGRFDLCTGETVQMPTTGGLDAEGTYHPTWSPAGRDPKIDPPGKKAEARRLTRVRRLRYYPVRIVDGRIEVALPHD